MVKNFENYTKNFDFLPKMVDFWPFDICQKMSKNAKIKNIQYLLSIVAYLFHLLLLFISVLHDSGK